jgi:hypothetical protein
MVNSKALNTSISNDTASSNATSNNLVSTLVDNPQLMTAEQSALYNRIQAFYLDKPDAQLSFSQRLARENNWSLQYAQQAVEEYKKFAFLAIAAGHPVTPSDPVDQVWHLHLTYTRSYWEEFCPQVLQIALHHDPTQGGKAENQKFDDWYNKTLESYERFFGIKPPVALWATPKDRFGRDLHFARINQQQNWILPKRPLQTATKASIAILFALILSGCQIGPYSTDAHPLAIIFLTLMTIATAFGVLEFLSGLVDTAKNPSRPGRGWDGGGSGCGGAGCGGWNDSDAGGHSAGDSGGGDGGCGGGGCGGGGCGGCGGG